MVRHTQTIRRQFTDESVFDHFVGLALKGSLVIYFSNFKRFSDNQMKQSKDKCHLLMNKGEI